jgi:hypothetical protein
MGSRTISGQVQICELGDFYLPSFSQLKDHAPGFEIGGSGDPGFWVVNFVAEKSGVPDQALEQLLKQRRIRIGM